MSPRRCHRWNLRAIFWRGSHVGEPPILFKPSRSLGHGFPLVETLMEGDVRWSCGLYTCRVSRYLSDLIPAIATSQGHKEDGKNKYRGRSYLPCVM